MRFKRKTLNEIADMICGNFLAETSFFTYRTSTYLTEFFEDCELEYSHDGSTRKWWVAGILEDVLALPQAHPQLPPEAFIRIIQTLMDQADALNEPPARSNALAQLNTSLSREGLQAYYDDAGVCQLKNTKTHTASTAISAPQRAWTRNEIKRRASVNAYLDTASEDDIIEEILLPLFRHLGFQRITAAGHRDKALEYGKDIWMKYRLPTMHYIYFGIQAKKGRLDASATSRNPNVSEILNQIRMMLSHTIFDPELNKRALVDHAIIVAGGEITKQARNWLGEHLDASQRSQILFMDRMDILDLIVLNNVPLSNAVPGESDDVDLPF